MPIQSEEEKQNSSLTDVEYVCLVAQGGLLGEVKPHLRGVSVEIVGEDVVVHGFYDGPYTYKEEDMIEIVATEILASLSPPSNATASITRCDCPKPLPQIGEWVYRRYESDGSVGE